jgi:hypothetical protein
LSRQIETYHCVDRLGFDERVVEHCPQISILGSADACEIVDQRGVEQTELVVHILKPLDEGIELRVPIFTDEEEIFFGVLRNVFHLEMVNS